MTPGKKKADMMLILGIGGKPRRASDDVPPRFGGAAGKADVSRGTTDIEPMGEQETSEGEGRVPPEAVSYHGGDERCDVCEYYSDGNCSWLKMPVDESGHCTLFENSGDDSMSGVEQGASSLPGME